MKEGRVSVGRLIFWLDAFRGSSRLNSMFTFFFQLGIPGTEPPFRGRCFEMVQQPMVPID